MNRFVTLLKVAVQVFEIIVSVILLGRAEVETAEGAKVLFPEVRL